MEKLDKTQNCWGLKTWDQGRARTPDPSGSPSPSPGSAPESIHINYFGTYCQSGS